jgi:hypothetical protein
MSTTNQENREQAEKERAKGTLEHLTAAERGRKVEEEALAAGENPNTAAMRGRLEEGKDRSLGVAHQVAASLREGASAVNEKLQQATGRDEHGSKPAA